MTNPGFDSFGAQPTHHRSAVEDLLATTPVMAILRGFGVEKTVETARRAWDLGIRLVEVPIQSPTDVEALAATVEAGRERGELVGAGTVVSDDHVRQAVAAGAAFTVAPGFDDEVLRTALDAGLAVLPGVATGSEVQAAQKLGLTWVKAFPAAELGASWFTAMRGPFPTMGFVATGGMDAHTGPAFLAAGARVIAVGSALNDPAQLPLLAELLGPAE
ncbi:bifunctional 4-hydroxy-2-oxoglutarate aldolase/2-dehydro-3-deoxy-phosphogluconate aldolase [Mariniluteicoccus flavus]